MTPDRIAQIRERAGWTLQQMGDTLGVTRQAVSAWERGVRNPTEYQQALLKQIEQELDARKKERERQQFIQAITGLAAGAGVAALLSFLFSNPNSGNSGDNEPTDQDQ
jgi:transcriptional regulator with XRE-family HTH domain